MERREGKIVANKYFTSECLCFPAPLGTGHVERRCSIHACDKNSPNQEASAEREGKQYFLYYFAAKYYFNFSKLEDFF